MNKLAIRKAGDSDLETFINFFRKTLSKDYFKYSKKTLEMMRADLSDESLKTGIIKGERILYLALNGETIIGYLLTIKPNGGVAFGHWIVVDENFQKKGVGAGLLRFWEDDVIMLRAHMLELYTTQNNVNFYLKQGFTMGEEVVGGWYGLNLTHFYKKLSEFDEDKYFRNNYRPGKKSK